MGAGAVEHQLAGPGLQRVEDDHRPVDQAPEALQAVDEVQGEAVGRPGRQAQRAGQPGLAHRRQPLPHRRVGVARAVGVVQEQDVEGLDADPRQAGGGGVAYVGGVLVGAAQARLGEAGKAPRAVAAARSEVVADRAHQAVVATPHAVERAAEERVGLARAVDVRGDHGAYPVVRSQQRDHALVVDRLTEAQEAPAAPGADGDVSGLGHAPNDRGRPAGRPPYFGWPPQPAGLRTSGASWAPQLAGGGSGVSTWLPSADSWTGRRSCRFDTEIENVPLEARP